MRKDGVIAGLVFAVSALVLVFSFPAGAIEYDYGNGRLLYVTGYVEAMTGIGRNDEPSYNAANGEYQTSGNPNAMNQELLTFYLETQLKWGRDLEFRTAWRIQGDEVDDFRDSDHWRSTYGKADNNINFDDELDDMVREFNIGYFSEYFNCRIGKQQLVWGEVDGDRIMDQINPVDQRRGYIFYDADAGYTDSRIPLWMAKTEFTTPMDFHGGGFSSLGLELTYIPDVDVWNRFEIGPREGGTWAYPVPDGYYMASAVGPLGLRQLNVDYKDPSKSLDHASFGARLKAEFLGSFITLNYFYGWSASGYLAPGPASATLTTGDIGFGGTTPLNGLEVWPGTTPGNVGDGAGLMLNVAMKTYRQKTVGFTFSRQLTFFRPFMKLMKQFDTPIMRVEALYQFDKRYNIFNSALVSMGLAPAFNLVIPGEKTVATSDEIRWMVGLDWFALRIPWINSKNKVTLSTQFINYHIMDHEDNMYQAPYNWPLKEDYMAWSILLGSSYYKEKIRPQVLFLKDTTYNSYFVKPRVQIDVGDHWRAEVGAYLIQGENSERALGLFDNRDTVYWKMKYQF